MSWLANTCRLVLVILTRLVLRILKIFPFYFVKNVPFNEIKINDHKIFLVLEGNMCWSTPPTCVRGKDSLNITTKNGYIFYSTK